MYDTTTWPQKGHVNSVSIEDIRASIKSLRAYRADEVDPISSDCFKHSTDLMLYYAMIILNLLLSHGYIPMSNRATFR